MGKLRLVGAKSCAARYEGGGVVLGHAGARQFSCPSLYVVSSERLDVGSGLEPLQPLLADSGP